jgi:hypothetical protein
MSLVRDTLPMSELKVISRWILNTNNTFFFLCHEPQTPSPTRSPITRPPTLTPIPGEPTLSPSPEQPTIPPSAAPSKTPTDIPSSIPSSYPSQLPTTPSDVPSNDPSEIPSSDPSSYPSVIPTTGPSDVPSVYPSSFPSESPSITILCDGRTLDEREEELLEIVSQLSDSNLLNDTTTNEYRAFRWLVDDDGMRVCPEDTLDVTQRYIMTLLYYSTNGDMWDECSALSSPTPGNCIFFLARYLTNVNVCFWFGVDCVLGGNEIDLIRIGKS